MATRVGCSVRISWRSLHAIQLTRTSSFACNHEAQYCGTVARDTIVVGMGPRWDPELSSPQVGTQVLGACTQPKKRREPLILEDPTHKSFQKTPARINQVCIDSWLTVKVLSLFPGSRLPF